MKKRSCSFVLAVLLALICTLPANAFPSDSEFQQDYAEDYLFEQISRAKVTSLSDEYLNQSEFFSLRVTSHDNDLISIKISATDTFLSLYGTAQVIITLPDSKSNQFEGWFSVDQSEIAVGDLCVDTAYTLLITAERGEEMNNFFGTFTIKCKDDTYWIDGKLTHEVYVGSKYIQDIVHQLEAYNSRVEQDLDLAQYGMQDSILSEIGQLAALASIRYEVEPNDIPAQANIIYDDDTTYGTMNSPGDVDYYRVQFPSSGNANFWLGDIPSGQDYDLYLYSAAGELLQRSTTSNNQEQIYNFPVIGNTWYYLCVRNARNTYSPSYYRIRAKNYTSSYPMDPFEHNNFFETATLIVPNTTLYANIHTETDVDFYKIILSAMSDISITLQGIPIGCDYDLELYDVGYNLIGFSRNGGASIEQVIRTVRSGTYYIKISSYSGASGINYQLTVAARESLAVEFISLYKSPRKPGLNVDGSIAADMTKNDYSLGQLYVLSSAAGNEAVKYDQPPSPPPDISQGPQAVINDMMQLATTYTSLDKSMTPVAIGMFKHFLAGTGRPYSNSLLTQKALEHSSTQEFANQNVSVIKKYIELCGGDIRYASLLPDFYNEMDAIRRPNYSSLADTFNGLMICVHDTWGYFVELTNYYSNGRTYQGTVHFTVYDHFGLDAPDIEKYGFIEGFNAWFVLQHYTGCNGAYTPFITLIAFDMPISGTIP